MNFSNIKKTALFSLMIAISTDQSFGFGVDSIKSFANNLVYNANPLNWIRQAQPIIQEKKISHELKEIFQLHNNENERRQKDIEMLMAQRTMGPLSQEQLRKIQSLMDLMQFGKDMEINIGLNKAQLEEITHFQILKYENTEWVKRSVNGENLDKLNYEYVDTTESSYSSPPLAYPPLH